MEERAFPECPVATTVELIGSKWKLLILRNLMARPWRFNELRKSLDGVSQKVLTDALRALEKDGIITIDVTITLPKTEVPQWTKFDWQIPTIESFGVWSPTVSDKRSLTPCWSMRKSTSRLAAGMPILEIFSKKDK